MRRRHTTIQNLVGKVFGRLKVLRYVGYTWRNHSSGTVRHHYWLCICSCGCDAMVSHRDLLPSRQHAKSCGCLKHVSRESKTRLGYGESSFNALFGSYARSARSRGHTFNIDAALFRALVLQDCFYCGRPPEQVYKGPKGTYGTFTYNGIDRVVNTIGYEPHNVRTACKDCNTAKGTKSEIEFYAWISRVHERAQHA